MKNIFFILILFFLIFSCEKTTPNLIVKGSVKNLNKGTLYLQSLQDTLLIKLDSVVINGTSSNFELSSNLSEPEVLYLVLDNNSKEKQAISFFADKGVTEINTTLKRFVVDAKIKGSELQKKLEEFDKVKRRFNDQNLKLIEERFIAIKSKDTSALEAISKRSDGILKRRYFFAVNFAMNNRDNQVAPYIALSEIYDANIKYLDTIYDALSNDISSSKYGKALNEFIKDRKTPITNN